MAVRTLCPLGCGRTTEDPYGGPCERCWAETYPEEPWCHAIADGTGRVCERPPAPGSEYCRQHQEGRG